MAQFSATLPENIFFCRRADASPRLPRDGLGRLCAQLPSPAFASPGTRLDIWLADDRSSWVVDNISLQAGYSACAPTTEVAFSEDFTGCPPILPGSWNGWTVSVSGSEPRCESYACLDPGLRLEHGTFLLERRVDASALASLVWLCWDTAQNDTEAGQVSFKVEFDAGSGWLLAYDVQGPVVAGEPLTCQRNCVDLTAISPQAAHNASLGIRFSAAVNQGGLLLDRIVVQGPDTCAAGSRLQLGQITEEGQGMYAITVNNISGHNLPVRLECSLPPATACGEEIFTFQVE